MESTACLEVVIRICTERDLDALMDLQETVCKALENSELFVPSSREENAGYLRAPNIILGVFHGERLVAYCSMAFPGTEADNLGWDLGWPADQVRTCAKVDTVVVDPAFRGHGLQRTLVRRAAEQAEAHLPGVFLLTTVSPQNSHSLHNMQAEGFQILLKTEKYNGRERFILGKATASQENIETT